jgi:glutathione S-transferase
MSNGKKMGQSVAILRFLAMQFGYYPADPLLAHKCNEFIDGYGDMFNKINGPAFNPDMDTTDIFEKIVPNFLTIVEKHLAT